MDLGLDYSVTALLLNLAYLVIGVAAGVGIIRYLFWSMNRSIGVTFTDNVWGELQSGNLAVAIYFGARLIAIFLFVGMLASALIR